VNSILDFARSAAKIGMTACEKEMKIISAKKPIP
jgi:hypothetical protein